LARRKTIGASDHIVDRTSQTMPTNIAYAKRFEAVLAHIDTHLDGDLSVAVLSRVASFSAYHFHRQFTGYVGVPVARYVQMMRLRGAARRLASQKRCAVLDVALDAGFDSPEAFSRAFKRAFGLTPSQFRRHPSWQVWSASFVIPHLSRRLSMQVQIIDFTETRVAKLEHHGAPGLLNASVRQFIEWRMQSGQSPVASSRTFGIPYGNPETTPPDSFRFAICGEMQEPVAPNSVGVCEDIIPGGRCAVIRHVGSPDHIGESIYPIYRDWLPGSGEELRDHPLFFHYLSVFPETPLEDWQTDIYVPLM
jgi:AraC family transcriptional regulator